MNALHAGIVIKSRLMSSEELNESIHGRIYPIIGLPGTEYPFILYCRTGVSPDGSKDYVSEQDETTVVVSIISDRYEESIELADLVQNVLQTGQTSIEGIEISEIRLTGFDEEFQDDAFIQNLTFNIEFEN